MFSESRFTFTFRAARMPMDIDDGRFRGCKLAFLGGASMPKLIKLIGLGSASIVVVAESVRDILIAFSEHRNWVGFCDSGLPWMDSLEERNS
jgi:hypothetical protein